MQDLEGENGCTRWKLSRDFRELFGTSLYRFLVMRSLECAQDMMQQGQALADVAATCHFADQSHLTRQFRKAFGVNPSRWIASIRAMS